MSGDDRQEPSLVYAWDGLVLVEEGFYGIPATRRGARDVVLQLNMPEVLILVKRIMMEVVP